MKIPRELLLIFAVLMIIAVATQQLSGGQQEQSEPDLISDSAAPGGARALYLWLQSLGYRVERLEYRAFKLDDASKVMLILAPVTRPGADELNALLRWIENGGTLVLAGTTGNILPDVLPAGTLSSVGNLDAVLKKFDLSLRTADSTSEATPRQPLLLHPPVSRARVESSSYVTGTACLVPYLGEPDRPVAAGLAVGKGNVYILASSYALSNQGLGQADNGALLLNWLPEPGQAGTVVFDEVHHGRSDERSLAYLVLHEPWGWGLLYALGMVFLYLALAGRRFGRPVPSIVDTRRAGAEYVVSLAGLLRRGGKGSWAARHYELTLRRNLAAACDLDPNLDSTVIAQRVGGSGRLAGQIEGEEASRVLLELRQAAETGISEGRLVHLAAETDRIIKTCSGRR